MEMAEKKALGVRDKMDTLEKQINQVFEEVALLRDRLSWVSETKKDIKSPEEVSQPQLLTLSACLQEQIDRIIGIAHQIRNIREKLQI